MRIIGPLLTLAPLLSLALAAPSHHQPHHPRHAHHDKRQAAAVGSAVSGAIKALPTWGFSSNALLVSGKDVTLLPLRPNNKIDSASYTNLTKILPTIMTNAIESSTHSWEVGSLVESLLEVYVPKLGPFEFDRTAFAKDVPWAALWVVEAWLAGYDWTGSPGNYNPASVTDLAAYLDYSTTPTPLSPKPLINGDGSLGDPVALGMGVWLLARYAQRSDVRSGLSSGLSSAQLAWACGNQLAYLQQGSASENGTLSQRDGYFQLWADMGSMIPPFPAYLGGDTSNDDLLSLAITQWQLESSALLDPSTGLYRHINDFDPLFWATGNGWMVHGGLRILANIEEAGRSGAFTGQIADVKNTLGTVFKALLGQLNNEGLLPNYMSYWDQSYAMSGGEAAGTAIVVAAYYRFINMYPDQASASTDAAAEKAFDGVVAKIDSEGWLTSVVNPMGPWEINGARSPEGQSFVGMMWAARTKASL